MEDLEGAVEEFIVNSGSGRDSWCGGVVVAGISVGSLFFKYKILFKCLIC